jgi:signal transduction histidine kinase
VAFALEDPAARVRAVPEAPGRVGMPSVATVMVAMGSLIGLTVWGQFASGTGTDLLVLDVVVGIVSWGLAPIVLRWPVAGTLMLSILCALSPAATPPATWGVLFIAQRRRLVTAVAVGACGIAAQAIRDIWRPINGLPFAWWLVLVVASYTALIGLGALVQSRRALFASLLERARRAEAEQDRQVAEARSLERMRIAREMHDVLAHRLSLLATYAGALEFRPDSSPEQLSRAAGVVRAGAHQALDELRQVITVLREDDGVASDDAAPPQPGMADLSYLVDESRLAGTPVQFTTVSDSRTLPAGTGRTAYRMVQEGLTNARKHAPCQPVSVLLDGAPGTGLLIDVCNSLPELPDASAKPPGAGAGLIGLNERVQLAGGQLEHSITTDGEFRLHAWLPWPA